MRKAFTLIELLVVIAIVGILAGIILPKLGNATDSARESTCRNNLRNLHAAVIDYANDAGGTLPQASWWRWEDKDNGILVKKHTDRNWIWSLNGTGNAPGSGPDESTRDPVFTNAKEVTSAIEYGVLFEYTGRNKKIYYCPSAQSALAKEYKKTVPSVTSKDICCTYVMNGAFGCGGNRVTRTLYNINKVGNNERAGFDGYLMDPSRVLLFAETVKDNNPDLPTEGLLGRPGTMFVLYQKSNSKDIPSFGEYHSGRDKDQKEGLVIFLDGHIEKHPPFYGDVNTAWRLSRGLSADGK